MDVCRACTNRSISLVDIFSDRPLPEFKCSLAEMINEIVNVALDREDKLPLKLCLFCSLSVQSAFKFKRMFEKNQFLLSQKVCKAESELFANEPKRGVQKEEKSPRLSSTSKRSVSTMDSPEKECKITIQNINENPEVSRDNLSPDVCIELSDDDIYQEEQSSANLDVGTIEENFLTPALPQTIDNRNSTEKSTNHNDDKDDLSQEKQGNELLNTKSMEDNRKIKKVSTSALDSRPKRGSAKVYKRTANQIGEKGYEPRFTCSYCQKRFSFMSSYSDHLRTHTGERPFKCDKCPHAFKRKDKLKTHLRLYHTTERGKRLKCASYKFPCTHCTGSFKTNTELLKHLRKHTGERPYKCDECGAVFTQSSHLTRHKYLHTGERPFKCTICSKGFIQGIHLKRHLESHDKQTLRYSIS